jgi:hypothetical protein
LAFIVGDLVSYRKEGKSLRGDRWQGRESVSEHSASGIDMWAEELLSVKPGV